MTGLSRGYGFVCFADPNTSAAVLLTRRHEINGLAFDCREAIPRKADKSPGPPPALPPFGRSRSPPPRIFSPSSFRRRSPPRSERKNHRDRSRSRSTHRERSTRSRSRSRSREPRSSGGHSRDTSSNRDFLGAFDSATPGVSLHHQFSTPLTSPLCCTSSFSLISILTVCILQAFLRFCIFSHFGYAFVPRC